MSTAIEMQSDKGLSTAFPASQEEDVSDNEDGSSSLSDIEDREADQEGLEPATSDIDNASEGNDSDVNDTEAETERLEDSPHSARKQKNVIMSSYNESKTYERSPSKLQNQLLAGAEADEEQQSGDEESVNESAKSGSDDDEGNDTTTAPTSLDYSVESQKSYTIPDGNSKKRKRHTIMDGGVAENSDQNEPANKRVGSIMDRGDTYLGEDEEAPVDEDAGNSNHISGDEGADDQEDSEEIQQLVSAKGPLEILAEASSKKAEKRTTRQNQDITNNVLEGKSGATETKINNGQDPPDKGDEEEPAEVEEYDEAEVALKNEEEVEKKRTAIDQLGGIEKHLRTFRIRLYEERIAQLELEEAQLKQDHPTHPEYLAMVRCLDERRDEKIRIAERLKEYTLKTVENFAVSRRSQILSQYAQSVRDIRETKLETLGKQWYDIQSDRRRFSSSVPDYAYKFSEKRSQNVLNQMAYNKEVSILSGVAKYVGFPAAPPMSAATPAEVEEDIERIRIEKQYRQPRQSRPIQDFAPLRAAASSRYKPAEEQFIEQHAWANPTHPAHAIYRQSSVHQITRNSSPFMTNSGPMRNGNMSAMATLSNAASTNLPHLNGTGRMSPHNPFSTTMNTHKVVPSPLGGSPSPSLQHASHHMQPHIQFTEHALPHTVQKEHAAQEAPHNNNFATYEAHRP